MHSALDARSQLPCTQARIAPGVHSSVTVPAAVPTVLMRMRADAVRVRLFPSERDVTVSAAHLAEPGAPSQPGARPAEDPALHDTRAPSRSDSRPGAGNVEGSREGGARTESNARAHRDSQGGAHSRRDGRGSDNRGERGGSSMVPSQRGGDEERQEMSSHRGRSGVGAGSGRRRQQLRTSWLREGIRVRVVSKHVGRGKVYLAKAWLTAVVAVGQCHIILDDGSVLEVCCCVSALERICANHGECCVCEMRRHVRCEISAWSPCSGSPLLRELLAAWASLLQWFLYVWVASNAVPADQHQPPVYQSSRTLCTWLRVQRTRVHTYDLQNNRAGCP